MNLSDEEIAFIVHETNRAMQALFGDDMPSLPWHWEPHSLRDSTVAGVRRVRMGLTPEQNHELWCDYKTAQGWVYGPDKDNEKKTHPCLVPWDQLPVKERAKVRVFYAVVRELAAIGEECRKPSVTSAEPSAVTSPST